MEINRIRITLLFLLLATTAHADVLVQYSFTGSSLNTTTNATGIAGGTITNASLNHMSVQSPGYATQPVLRTQSPSTTSSGAVTANAYFSFSVTPTNLEMDLTSLTFTAAKGGASGPRGYVLRTSIDSYANNVATADIGAVYTSMENVSISLTGASFQNITSAVTFRLYVYGTSGTANVEFDSFTLNGTLTSTQGGGGGTTTFDTFDDAPPTLTRYIQMQRSGTTCTAKIYSDENYSVLLDTLTVTCATDTYRYLDTPLANNTGVSGTTFSGSVQNVDVNVQLGSTCDDVCTLCATQATCEAGGGITCYWWDNNSCQASQQPASPAATVGVSTNGTTIGGCSFF